MVARTLEDITAAMDMMSEEELNELLNETRLSRFTPKEVSPHKERRPRAAAARAAQVETGQDQLTKMSPEDLAKLKAALRGEQEWIRLV